MQHKRTLTPSQRRRGSGHVYFLRCQGFIKIGSAGDASARHKAVQTVSPFEVELLCAIPGNEKLERQLHQRFGHLRERGEWFRAAPELDAFIAACLEETRTANLREWTAVAICDACGKDTLCRVRRQTAETAVVPMKLTREMGCISCALKNAHKPSPSPILPLK